MKIFSLVSALLVCDFTTKTESTPLEGLLEDLHHEITDRASQAIARTDRAGNVHERFTLEYRGIPVFGMQEIVHLLADGRTRIKRDEEMTRMLVGAKLNTVATIPELTARATATDLCSQGYQGNVQTLSAETDVYLHEGIARLVWKVLCDKTEDDGNSPPSMPEALIDAHSGEVVQVIETLATWIPDTSFALEDSDKKTLNWKTDEVGVSSNSKLLEIHVNTQHVLNFLMDVCGMDSYNGNGAQVISVGNRADYSNAYYNGVKFVYGNGNGYSTRRYGTLDIVAHEVGHAGTRKSSSLVYKDEPGAINEGASDIMGAMVDYYVAGSVTTDTWNLGEETWLLKGSRSIHAQAFG